MVRAITVERYLIAGKLLFLAVDFTLHETQLAVIIKAHTDMFRGFTIDIEFNKLEFIALPAVFAQRGIPVVPRAKGGEKMGLAVGIFAPKALCALVPGVAAGGEGGK